MFHWNAPYASQAPRLEQLLTAETTFLKSLNTSQELYFKQLLARDHRLYGMVADSQVLRFEQLLTPPDGPASHPRAS